MMTVRNLVRLLLVLAFSLAAQSISAQVSEGIGDIEYERPDLSEEPPVELDIWQQDGALGVSFVRPEPNGIEIQMKDQEGSVIVFWEFMDQFEIRMPKSDEMARALEISDPEERAETIGPTIEPLFPLAGIPPDSTNIHELIDEYLETLVEAENWVKLYELSEKMFLDKTPRNSIDYFFVAAKNLYLEGDEERALRLLNQLVAARPLKESKGATLEIAAQFMKEHLFRPALRLYQTYAPHTEGPEGKRINLICAYLSLELDRQSDAQYFIRRAEDIPDGNVQSNATRKLIGGVQAQKKGQTGEALNQLGFALSAFEPSDPLRVIALYYNYLAYQSLEKTIITDSILKEMQLLFGRSMYSKKLSSDESSHETEDSEAEEIPADSEDS